MDNEGFCWLLKGGERLSYGDYGEWFLGILEIVRSGDCYSCFWLVGYWCGKLGRGAYRAGVSYGRRGIAQEYDRR